MEFHKIWVSQCEAAENIREQYGTNKALADLIGEKLLSFVEESDTRPEFAAELPSFVAAVREIFEPHEIRVYLENVQRIGMAGHVCNDAQFEVLREYGFFSDDAVRGAEQVLLLARVKELFGVSI